jgi:hypothetical protein
LFLLFLRKKLLRVGKMSNKLMSIDALVSTTSVEDDNESFFFGPSSGSRSRAAAEPQQKLLEKAGGTAQQCTRVVVQQQQLSLRLPLPFAQQRPQPQLVLQRPVALAPRAQPLQVQLFHQQRNEMRRLELRPILQDGDIRFSASGKRMHLVFTGYVCRLFRAFSTCGNAKEKKNTRLGANFQNAEKTIEKKTIMIGY